MATKAKDQGGDLFVIQHTGVDSWSQGQLVCRDDFKLLNAEGKEVGDRFDRLVSLGAIRPASEHEAKMGKGITAPGFVSLSPADQMRLATMEAELERLRSVVGDQNSKLASYERLGVSVAAEDAGAGPEVSAMLQEKQAELEALRETVDDNHKRLEEIHKLALERQAAAAKEAGKQPSGASGSTAPVEPGKAVEQGAAHDKEARPTPAHPHQQTRKEK